MLAEMTRAFNVGFGLGAHGLGASGNNHQVEGGMTVTPDNSNPESSDSGTPPLATLPPEGSFDRFLMDLQIDLRTALTQVEDPPRTPTPQGRRSTPPEPVQQPQETEAGTENATSDGLSSTSYALPETQPVGDQHAVNVDSDRSSMPDLEVYDTDSEFEDAEDSDDDGALLFHFTAQN